MTAKTFATYTGRYMDSASGFYNYRARNYDAHTGRFTSEDPLRLAAGDTNLSRYVGNNPGSMVDPSGMQEGTGTSRPRPDEDLVPVNAAGLQISEEQFLSEISEENWQNRHPHHVVTLLTRFRAEIPPDGMQPIEFDETEEYYTMRWVLGSPSHHCMYQFKCTIEDTRTREDYYGAGPRFKAQANAKWQIYVEDVDYLISEAKRLRENPDEIQTRMQLQIFGDTVKGFMELGIAARYAGPYTGRHRLKTGNTGRQQRSSDPKPTRAAVEAEAEDVFLNEGGGQIQGRPVAVQAEQQLAPNSGPVRTNAQLVQDIATRAEAWGARKGYSTTGRVEGTLKHGYADKLLERYQLMFGDRGLSTEVRYYGGRPWTQGDPLKGSIRLDVVEGPVASPTAVFDYKFGNATLTPPRILQIRRVGGIGPSVPVTGVKP
ncbi:MAG: RHS repeat-associated core domain-containing protein [Planctomycetaceae bacterium]